MSVPGLPATSRELAEALHQSPAFRRLPIAEQQRMQAQAEKVFGYLEGAPSGMPLAQPLTDGLPPPPGSSEGGGSTINDPVRAAGSIARNTLDSIDFPTFVASLVQGTFQAIVDSSIQQMEAYSQLLSSVAKTVDEFMDDHITDDMAKDHLANNFGGYFTKNVSSSGPQLGVAPSPPDSSPLPGFLQDMGFTDLGDIDEPALNETVIPAAKRTLAETRHQSLATMVMMGLNRLIVDEGEINAKLVFNIDASQSSEITFDDTKTTNWGMAGTAGRNQFGATGVVVTTTNVNTQSDIELRAELTGEVRIKFSSDVFPLERFADSAAIQLINNHAKPLPPPAPATDAEGEEADEEVSASSQSLGSPARSPQQPAPTDNAWSVRAPEEPR
ncbi:MAG: hypothetical protein QNI90_13340 [Dinoroseobacter sp.]|nr:hypothetical protein [Dinoroseobacter sp.]